MGFRLDRPKMRGTKKPNRLINEKSPYLLEHAYNPVDWYPWGDEAFAKARRRTSRSSSASGTPPVTGAIVMAQESFEDEKIAAILNEKFVPIKVDREERPDLDEIYMKAVTTLTGQGGWPLSVFLTPDLKPFYGGTYFPPVPRHGLPGFPEVLNFIADTWKTKRQEVVQSSEEITKAISDGYALKARGRSRRSCWTTPTRSSSPPTTRSSGGSAARRSSRSRATSGSSCATTPGRARGPRSARS